jgi:predicted enzyme related to lactoylglutathione lyase
MKTLVAFFEIPAVDFDRAIGFYESLFGIKLTILDCGHEKMAFFPEENGLCPGAISWAAKESFIPSENGVLISLNVEDMKQATASIERNGGWIIIPKTKIEADNRGYFAVFIDSEGNRVGLYSER